jgi:TRAP-type C4-dicarboxylate transport system permease small subunit
VLDQFDRSLRIIERAFDFAAAVALMLMMISIFGDVVSRHVFGQSLVGVHEITEMYLMAAVVFLSVSRAQDLGKHIAVDALVGRLEGRVRSILEAISFSVGFAVLAPISWKALQMTLEHFHEGRVTSGVVEFPIWIGWLAVTVGCLTLSVRLLLQLIRAFEKGRAAPREKTQTGPEERP